MVKGCDCIAAELLLLRGLPVLLTSVIGGSWSTMVKTPEIPYIGAVVVVLVIRERRRRLEGRGR